MPEQYLTVTALTKYIKYKFDCDKHLSEVLLTGEISNFTHHSRGHFYFTLKDEKCSISAMMFSSSAKNVKFEPQDGMKVFVKGNVSVYEASGTYQIIVKELKSDGIGDLYLAYEALKKELSEAHMFDIEHKRPLPSIPNSIGVVTSPTGAAIRDIVNTVGRRYPFTKLILYPALVQGEGAKESIVKQIKLANEQKLVDVLIVGRGGGSLEDLWAFNERIVAEAIYNSDIPVISAVGHEIDFTIADYVADRRAATPTAAAELATPNLETLKEYVLTSISRMDKSLKNLFETSKMRLGNLDRLLDKNNPKEKLIIKRKQIDDLVNQLRLIINNDINNKKHTFYILSEKLKALNPLSIMDKGYSIASVSNKIVKSISDVKKDDELRIRLVDGYVKTKVVEVNENGK